MPITTQRPIRVGDAPQPPRTVRRLAKPLTPAPGEWLQTAISRWAFDVYKCSRRDLLEALGVGTLHPVEIRGLGVALRPETAATISAASGIPFVQLYAMTQSMRDRATWDEFTYVLRERQAFPFRERDLIHVPLFREVIHKWCPDCLHERPGVHDMMWRHPWLHICLKHSRVLATTCPACGEQLRIPLGRTVHDWDPRTCPNRVQGVRCAEPLSRAESSRIDDAGMLYATQVRIIALARSQASRERSRLYDLSYRIPQVQELSDKTIAALTGLDENAVQRLMPRRLERGGYVRHLETFSVLAAAETSSSPAQILFEKINWPLGRTRSSHLQWSDCLGPLETSAGQRRERSPSE
jgi:hypothetical protein